MATPKQNYARQFQAYAQGIEPDIPASVRTYSIFNPDTGTWQRMTNNFRSPIPVQGQAVVPVQAPAQPAVDPVVAALAMAQQTRGRDWSRPLPQTPAQMPSKGSIRPSPASGKQKAVPAQTQSPSEPLNLVRNPAFLATGRDFQSDYDPSLYNGKANILAQQINPNVPQVYQGFNYFIPDSSNFDVVTSPTEVRPVINPNNNPTINTKVEPKPFALQTKSEREKAALQEATENDLAKGRKFRRIMEAQKNGTYSPLKELFGFYGWVPDYFK